MLFSCTFPTFAMSVATFMEQNFKHFNVRETLDAANREIVVGLIKTALARGTAMIGIFHDADVRDTVATRLFHVEQYAVAA